MSGSGDYTLTPNLNLYKPVSNKDVGAWGTHWNLNADTMDSALATSGSGGLFLPLSGGAMVGPTTFTGTVTSGAASPATPPLLQTTWNVNNSDGAVTTYQCQTDNQTYINNPVGQNIWANRNELFYRSPTPTNTRTSYIAATSHTLAFTDRGTAAGAPQIWAHLMECSDHTGHPSSVGGQLLTLEVDIGAAGLDDANNRAAVVVVGATYNYPTNASSEFTSGISVSSGDAGATFKDQLTLAGKFNRAGINFTQSTSVGNAPAIWLNTGQSIAFDNAANMQFRWSAANSRYEFQWLGSPHWSLNPAGDVTVTGTETITGSLTVGGTVSGAGFTSLLASPPPIGSTAAAAGSFTTLAASGAVSGAGFSNYLASPPAIGGTAAAAGTFTTLRANYWLFAAFNVGASLVPAAGNYGAIAWNVSNGGAETSYVNCYTGGAGTSHTFWQQTGASTSTRLMDIGPTGNVTHYGSAGINGPTGPTWTSGSAAPAAVAPVGSLYSRVGGAVGATLYVSRGAGTWAPVAGV